MSVPALRFKDESGRDFPEWVSEKLGKIGTVLMCKRILKEQTLPVGDVPFYKIGTFGKQPDAYITNEVYKSFKEKYSFPKKGDILISAAGTIGRTVVFDGLPAYFQDSNIVWIDNNEVLVKNAFLYYLYANTTWNTENTTIARLYNDNLRSILIKFPSISEQTKIANFLTTVDDKITQLTQKHELLTQYKKGVMQQIFSQELRFKDDDGQDFPEWEETNLGNVLEIQGGYAFKSTSFNAGNTMVIRIGDILPNIKLGSFIGVFSSEVPNNKYIVKKNDFMMALSGATFGKVGKIIDDGIAYINQRVATFRTKQNLEFFYQVVQSQDFRNYIASIPTASAQPNISNDDIGRYEIAVPSIAEQLKIANFLTAIDDKITTVQTQLQAVKQYKQGLLQQMFV